MCVCVVDEVVGQVGGWVWNRTRLLVRLGLVGGGSAMVEVIVFCGERWCL